uniref:Uncharacterized protein n=1 Tax=Timema genevievae TaxID=629358 RepID=A0A7R9JXE7_TIMGE|nr:unnamed protein product [Timema genevievae]
MVFYSVRLQMREDDKPGLKGQEDDKPGLEGQEDDKPGLEFQEDDKPGLECQEDDTLGLECQEDDKPGLEYQEDNTPGQEDDKPGLEGQEDDKPGLEGQEDDKPGLECQEDDKSGLECQEDDKSGLECQEDDKPGLECQEDDKPGLECQEDDKPGLDCQEDYTPIVCVNNPSSAVSAASTATATNTTATSSTPYDTKPPVDPWQAQAMWEESHMGNFRCIYPGPVKEKFERFFHQNASSLFQDTAASRAREECTRLLREEMEVRILKQLSIVSPLSKAREEAARRAGGGRLKEAADRLRPESPMGREHPRLRVIPPIKRAQVVMKKPEESPESYYVLNSFKPDNIVEEDERERMSAMLEREQLVQSYSITNLVLEMVKRSEKPKRDRAAMCGLYGKLSLVNECHPYVPPHKNRQPSFITHLMTTNLNNLNPPTLPTPSSKVQGMLVAAKTHHVPPSDRCSNRSSYPDVQCLTVQCNNVTITSRPVMPALISAAVDYKDREFRSTKAHVARAYTNNVKLQELEKREQRQMHYDR